MIRHISTSIDGLLAMSDRDLETILPSVKDENGKNPESVAEFRKYLEEEHMKGHRLLPCPECDNFDPVHGCLGHPPVEYVPS